ncbi:hypothetical protein EDD37DRAFT_653954 [Exophiala viscosa]|uniref:uncharacterized protein n=1 Tax=Exophiala viscosa TaxID=2486360 RepID=UPI00219B0721|nr:hypothetical protein EDD37DRAFT_653954 [Exophiala viscosa]
MNSDTPGTGGTPGKSQSFARSPIVTFIVGPEKAVYTAHKAVVIDKCPFVAKCLAAGMVESTTYTIEFPEDEPAAFDQFISWIYRCDVDEIEKGDTNKLINVLMAWVLADKLCMPAWQNESIDQAMAYWTTNFMEPEVVSWATDHLSNTSLLFSLIVDQFAWDVMDVPGMYTNESDDSVESTQRLEIVKGLFMRPDFPSIRLFRQAVQTALDFVSLDRPKEPASDNTCKYHVHEAGKTCESDTEEKGATR